MTKEFLQAIPGVATYPIISLVLFSTLFFGVVIWAFFRLDKKYINRMEKLPLESSNSSILNGE
jgi:hypothetical protein